MKIRVTITAVAEFEVEDGEDPKVDLALELADFEENPRAYTTINADTFTVKGEIIE